MLISKSGVHISELHPPFFYTHHFSCMKKHFSLAIVWVCEQERGQFLLPLGPWGESPVPTVTGSGGGLWKTGTIIILLSQLPEVSFPDYKVCMKDLVSGEADRSERLQKFLGALRGE